MKQKNYIYIQGTLLNQSQLNSYLEKIASDHILTEKANKNTCPIKRLNENYIVIKEVYNLLNEHIKIGIPIHPAGEWLLDNFYIIEEVVKNISKDLTNSKYTNFLGISNEKYKGFARIYVLASEMVAYTDGKIDDNNLEEMLRAYQTKQNLTMNEIWNIGVFIQIALIENIRNISEKVYWSQIQKYKVENIIERIIDNNKKPIYKNHNTNKKYFQNGYIQYNQIKFPFVEYMSYKLKKYGRRGLQYEKILEDEINKAGSNISDVIKKEHFDIALKKVSIGNSITSLKNMSRIDFLGIFEKINGVEDILKQDPAGQYSKMDNESKSYYRNTIQEISKNTKLSEIYIAKQCINLCQEYKEQENEKKSIELEKCACNKENIELIAKNDKKAHVGYYLISDGKEKLLSGLLNKNIKIETKKSKAKNYISIIWLFTIIASLSTIICLYKNLTNKYFVTKSLILCLIMAFLIIIPFENIFTKIIQYILSKSVKPKLIPKLDFQHGIPEEYATMVVIPTILKNREQVNELFKKLEVYYLANKSENLYFCLLGDCSSEKEEIAKHDNEIIEVGINKVKELNEKYIDNKFNKFNFIYRKRVWNEKEGCFLGWERKRGMLNQFNQYLLSEIKNPFRVTTMENKIPNIKYVITLDSDTELPLNTGLKLIGTMAHILNEPVLNKDKDLVIDGHGIIAPRVGVNLEDNRKSLFTMLYSSQAGTDSYTNAISDVYQDNFDEGIFAGKGIYNLKVFNVVLSNEIKENTVLSHDLLEGDYLRCGFASDIMLMDGCPTNYLSYKKRLYRWTRGDYQILLWLRNKIENKKGKYKKNPLTKLSKYKIISNIFRESLPIKIILLLIYSITLSIFAKEAYTGFFWLSLISITIPLILDVINAIICRRNDIIYTKTFTKNITGIAGSFYRTLLDILILPDMAYMLIKAKYKTLYRMLKSKKHLLEWETSEEAERNSKQDLKSYLKNMKSNIILGIIGIIIANFIINYNLSIKMMILILSTAWFIAPFIMYKISQKYKVSKILNKISSEKQKFLEEVAEKTWLYFKENLTVENNYLPPDNYQEDRKPKFINRTSSTNIGLAILATISSYDLQFATLEDTINLLNNMVITIANLPKWNGHLYNWYNINTLEVLTPKYVSSVDSGNFVGYMYVLLQFLKESKEKNADSEETINKINTMIETTKNIINNSDFSKLYDEKTRLFSVGYNVEENKLTDSYYDLLASEARQTSFIAIAKKDISPKHWNNLNRTLTMLNKYKGLLSWSGTSFEYLMPTIVMPQYEGSILDESCKFLIMSQKEYADRLGVPWGFSEAAFNLKDLYNNYQYKAFGIPWLGLKRGLADEVVVSSYGSILAILYEPINVLSNIEKLRTYGMYDKYGFYESLDFTPNRVSRKSEVVKTYMAHHQGLILMSINNLFNEKIMQKRFMENPEMQAIKILLEEKMPDNMVITKEEKEKVEKIKYVDYECYTQRVYNKIDEYLNIANVISNDKYSVVMDQYGNGYSNYNNLQINRFKATDDEAQGVIFYIKNVTSKRIWTNTYSKYMSKPDKYNVTFAPNIDKISRIDGDIETVTKVFIDNDEPVEIRKIELYNMGNMDQTIEITSYLEPILSKKLQDYGHKAFNNLFVTYEHVDNMNAILVKRTARLPDEKDVYMLNKIYIEGEEIKDVDFEIDKEKFYGRCNIGLPKVVENSSPLSRKIEQVVDPIVALKKVVNIKSGEKISINLIMSTSFEKEQAINNAVKFMNEKTIERTIELSKARVEAETRYLGIKGKDIETYQRMLAYLIFPYKISTKKEIINVNSVYDITDLWKYGISGDIPILLFKIKDVNDIDTLKEVISAYEYFRSLNIKIDLAILNEEKDGYDNYVKDAIQAVILNKSLGYMVNIHGGIFCLNNVNSNTDKMLLEEKADVIINASKGTLNEQLNEIEQEIKEKIKQSGYEAKNELVPNINNTEEYTNPSFNDKLKYYNEYGGFSQDGKEYLIKINKNNRLPTVWSHILANENFGTLLTENMGGYTWKDNSRLNRLTAWSNNQVADVPSEVIYLKDIDNGQKWSLGANPMPDNCDYFVKYGFGYAQYTHFSSGIEQELNIFVPKEDNVKVNLLHLENRKPESKHLKLIYYIKPVMGEDEIKNNKEIFLQFNSKSNAIFARNTGTNEKNIMFIGCSEKMVSFTGNKGAFLKNSTISNPDGLEQLELNGENSYGTNGIIAIEITIKLEALSSKDISIILGECDSNIKCQDIAYKYSNVNNCKEELIKTKKYWENIVNKIQVRTPSESMNILLNGWLIYQTITSRLYGRTGFYQSGGAFGYRDQLQDCLAVKYFLPTLVKEQIIKHSKHQFIEGDVEHWWHEETYRGIRTKFSDDLLWLPYLVANYVEYTNDYSILEETTPYLNGNILQKNEYEKYDKYLETDEKETIYQHCKKAIEKSLNFGENGIPLIGSGDWNDGFSNVGIKGKGESVWLGFFVYEILKKIIPFCKYKNDNETAKKYEEIMEKLRKALNGNGWDGRWYRRAFADDGSILGTIQNDECRIDSIAQSWATISGAGDNDKKYISMESLDNHLVDREDSIIKLLDPAFERSKLEPGYIKSYIPGTRENGGQYTHGAIWAVIANAMLNLNDRAFEYFRIINPIEHSRSKEMANKYKVEPYVVAADVYGVGNLAGRGGWTWYTGSSSWMYVAGIEYILGVKIRDGFLEIEPHVPNNWEEYEIKFNYENSMYNIIVKQKKLIENTTENARKNKITKLDGSIIENDKIKLDKSGGIYNVEVELYI